MTGLAQDLRYALRQLRKAPGFTMVAVVTLALGIGANTAIFSLVNAVLLRPLRFPQENKLVQVTDAYPQGALVAMRAGFRTMDVAGYRDGEEMNVSGLGEPTRLNGTAVSANFFSVLGAQSEFGRVFLDGEDQPGRDNVVVLSHALWQQLFGGNPEAIGRFLMLEGVSRQIIGVMPADFQLASSKAQFWVPLRLDPSSVGAYWGGGFMPVVGRLRPAVTLEQANAEVHAQIPQLRRMFPWRMP